MPDDRTPTRPIALAVFLVIAGALGLLAAFRLSVEKVEVLTNGTGIASCDVGVLVGCSTNLGSAQGEVFGFPNPFIGMMAWPVVITIGVALLAGVRFPRWFWVGFNIGLVGALAFVIWLIVQSIYVLDVLCPWCMLTWAVTIPVFWTVTLRNLKEGAFRVPDRVRRIAAAWYGWIPAITVVSYAVVILLAQAQMNAIPRVLLDLRNYFA